MRLLQLVPEPLPTHRADVVALFGRYLPRYGVACDIVGKGGGTGDELEGFRSIRTSAAKGGRLRRELSYLWHSCRALIGASRRYHEAIQVRDMVSIGLLALIVARLKGIPFIYWMSFLMSEGRLERARLARERGSSLRALMVALKGYTERFVLYKLILPRAEHVFVQSNAMRDFVLRRGLDGEKISAVPMGVDREQLLADSIQASRPAGWESGPLIAYLGTLDGQRRLWLLVEALAHVRTRFPDARLLLIGDSQSLQDEADICNKAEALGLDDAVRITGWLRSSEAWSLLKGADVAVSPIPRGEIFDTSSPTKLVEYLALGIPSVGNDNPDQQDVIVNSNAGWLTEDTPSGYGSAICQILADLPAARERAVRGVSYVAQERSYEAIAAHVGEIYRRVLEGAR